MPNEYLKTIPENIPDCIKNLGPTFVCWKAITKPGRPKPIKMPIDPKTGRAAKSTDSSTWGTWDEAIACMQKDPSISGVGLVFRRENGLVGIDLDNVIDANGDLLPDVEALVNDFKSYTELSPSGKGLHILVKADGPEGMTSLKRPDTLSFAVELFVSSYYLTLTGHLCEQVPSTVADGDKPLARLLDALEASPRAKSEKKKVFAEEAPTGLRSLQEFEDTVLPKLAALEPRDRKESSIGNSRAFKWSVLCPWRNSHTNGDPEAAIFLHQDGRPGFKCLHSHCAERGWRDLQKHYDLPAAGPVAQYNESYAVVDLGGKVRIMREVKTADGSIEERFMSTQDFMLYNQTDKETFTGPDGKPVTISKPHVWLNSPKRRQFSRIEFEPGLTLPPDHLNLFRGWNIQPKQGDWSLFRQHLQDNICKGNEGHYRWLMGWIAHIFQHPGGERVGTCPVLSGGQGTGKTTVGSIIGHLAHPYYLHLSRSEQLVGKFNHHLKGKIFCVGEEAFFAGAKQDVGRLKTLITDEYISVEPKGIDAFQVRSHLRLMLNSNHGWIVPAEHDERRFFVLNVSNARAKDTKYFSAIYEQMRNGGYEALFHDLLNWNIDVNLREVPQTEGLAEQKQASLSSPQEFWYECVQNGEIILADIELRRLEDGENWPREVKKTELYNGYLLYCRSRGSRHPAQSNIFWRELWKVAHLKYSSKDTTKTILLDSPEDYLKVWDSVIGTTHPTTR